jgi:hypothetical protein
MILRIIIICVGFICSCGPASEDRTKMHADAKRIKDSMEKHLQERLQEAEGSVNIPVQPATSNSN